MKKSELRKLIREVIIESSIPKGIKWANITSYVGNPVIDLTPNAFVTEDSVDELVKILNKSISNSFDRTDAVRKKDSDTNKFFDCGIIVSDKNAFTDAIKFLNSNGVVVKYKGKYYR